MSNKSHELCFQNRYIEAGIMTFAAHWHQEKHSQRWDSKVAHPLVFSLGLHPSDDFTVANNELLLGTLLQHVERLRRLVIVYPLEALAVRSRPLIHHSLIFQIIFAPWNRSTMIFTDFCQRLWYIFVADSEKTWSASSDSDQALIRHRLDVQKTNHGLIFYQGV